MSNILLVECGPDRLDQVMAIMNDAFDPAFGEAWSAPQCCGMLNMPGVWMTLAMESDHPAGFSVARVVADEAELLLLGVRRASWRNGIGRRLLQGFCEAGKHRGAKRLHLEMRDGNAAIAMYAHAGFEQVGRRRNYYRGSQGDCFDALTLSCSADALLL